MMETIRKSGSWQSATPKSRPSAALGEFLIAAFAEEADHSLLAEAAVEAPQQPDVVKVGEDLFVEVPDAFTRDVVQRFVDLLPNAQENALKRESEQRLEALIPLFLVKDPIANTRRKLELDNAKLRAEFVVRHPCFTAADLSDFAGHGAKNRSVTASRWKAQGRIFSVPFRGAELYPVFQLADGEPKAAVARVLRALPDTMTAWQRAFWFTTPNGWLGGAAPADGLNNTDAVVAAAEQEAQPIG